MGLFPGSFLLLFHLPHLPGKQRSNTKHLASEVWCPPIHMPGGQIDPDRPQCYCTIPGILFLRNQNPRMIPNAWMILRNVIILLGIQFECWMLGFSPSRMLKVHILSLLIRGKNNFSHSVCWASLNQAVLKLFMLPTTSSKYKCVCRGACTSSHGREICLSLLHITKKFHKKHLDLPSLSAHSL